MEHRFRRQGKEHRVRIEISREGGRAWIDGRERTFVVRRREDGILEIELEGRIRRIFFAREGERLQLAGDGITFRFERLDPLGAERPPQHHEQPLEAPMPGLVRLVPVREGESVERGQTLVVLEAMKMEIRIAAPQPGRVKRLCCEAGEQVDRGQVLVELDSDTESKP
jgi:3-methylcrotonyl-CoA carboxylase alpha subunit